MTDTGPEAAPSFVEPDESSSGFACDECSKVAKTAHALRMHKRYRHGAEPESQAASKPAGRPAGRPKKFTAPKAPRTAAKASEGALREAAHGWVLMFYGMGGGILAQVTPEWGSAVAQCSNEQMVTAWVQMAKRHQVIRDLLLSGEAVSTYAMFVAAHQPLIQLAQSKVMAGFIPPDEPDPMGRPAPGSPADYGPVAQWETGGSPAEAEPSWPDAA